MKKLLLLMAALFSFPATQAQDFRVIAYTTAWSELDPDSIRYDLLTHINYSFLIPASDGSLEPLDNPAHLERLVEMALANEVNVVIGIGGWELGHGGCVDTRFERLASDPSRRAEFLHIVIKFVETNRLEAVDMDWE